MELWARNRAVGLLAVAAGLLVLVAFILGDRDAALPAVLGGGVSVLPISLFLPLLFAAALAHAFDGRDAVLELRTARALGRLDVVLFLGIVGTTSGLLFGLVVADIAPRGVAFNVLILGGVAVAVTSLLGSTRGIAAATAMMLLTSSYSPHVRGATYVRVLQPEARFVAVAATAFIAVAATMVLLQWSARPVRNSP